MLVLYGLVKVYAGGCVCMALLLLLCWPWFHSAGNPSKSGRDALITVFGWPLMIYDLLATKG